MNSDMKDLVLPTFYIIGAAKSGTTSLHYLLKQHAEIFMPAHKEPHFFGNDDRYKRGMAWYSATFYRDAAKYRIRGDASPSYLEQAITVAPRIKENYQNGQVRFIAIFRHPVQRAYSAYWHRRRNSEELPSFEQAIGNPAERRPERGSPSEKDGISHNLGLVSGSMYATNLRPFLALFPRENFFFLLQEDLARDLQASMRKLFLFLGADPDFEVVPESRNTASLPRFEGVQKFLLSPSGPFHKLLKPITHEMAVPTRRKVRRFMFKFNLRPFSYPPMEPETEKELRQFFSDEIKELETIMGRDLSAW